MTADRNAVPAPQLLWQGRLKAVDDDKHEYRLARVHLSPADLDAMRELGVEGHGQRRGYYLTLEWLRPAAMGEESWHYYDDDAQRSDALATSEEVLAEIVTVLAREARGLKVVK